MSVYEWMFQTGYPLWWAAGLGTAILFGWIMGETERKWTEREQRIAERRKRLAERHSHSSPGNDG